MIELPRLYAIGKQLIYGLEIPVNQYMYDGVCSVIHALWGQAGYGILYENVVATADDKGAMRYYLIDPDEVYQALVGLLLFNGQT